MLLLMAAALAASLRLYQLADRPVHTDEAVNAFQVGEILNGKIFRYTSVDYHGPLFFALSALCAKAAGATSLASMDEWSLRWPAALSSLLLLLLIAPLARFVGPAAALVAAFLWALNPMAVYYGRYAIHESLFVSLTLAFLLALPKALQNRDWRWQATCALLAALMIATKETAVISVVGAFLAALVQTTWRHGFTLRGLLIGTVVGAATAIPCFTWGFQNPLAIFDLLAAAENFISRAGGQGHQKAWSYYGEILLQLRSGPVLALTAAAGGWLWRSHSFGRYLSIYALAVFTFYSLIPYKTPWLLLSLVVPLVVLAGIALALLWKRSACLAAAAAVLILASSMFDVVKLSFKLASDERNPLAYAHALPDLTGLPPLVHQWQQQNGRPPKMAVITADPWPLPWYLRHQPTVGYWQKPEQLQAMDILILDPEMAQDMALEGWRPTIFGQRPGSLLMLYRRTNQP